MRPFFGTICDNAEYLMYKYKTVPCPKQEKHNWSLCHNTHPGESNSRMEPRRYFYHPELCQNVLLMQLPTYPPNHGSTNTSVSEASSYQIGTEESTNIVDSYHHEYKQKCQVKPDMATFPPNHGVITTFAPEAQFGSSPAQLQSESRLQWLSIYGITCHSQLCGGINLSQNMHLPKIQTGTGAMPLFPGNTDSLLQLHTNRAKPLRQGFFYQQNLTSPVESVGSSSPCGLDAEDNQLGGARNPGTVKLGDFSCLEAEMQNQFQTFTVTGPLFIGTSGRVVAPGPSSLNQRNASQAAAATTENNPDQFQSFTVIGPGYAATN